MKIINYLSIVGLMVLLSTRMSGQAGGAPDIDYGLFGVGVYNTTPPAQGTMEVAFKPLFPFGAVPAAAELNFILKVPSALYNPSVNFDVTHEATFIGLTNMNYDPLQTFEWNGFWYFVFAYNGSGINLSSVGSGSWKYAFTIYITNMSPATPSSFTIADGSSTLYTDFSIRSSFNFGGNNEFLLQASVEALPLDLVSFEATKLNERSSYLTWTTVNEVNTNNFVVQRSLDKKSWSNIGIVKSAGNSVSIENYSFVDENVYNGHDASLTPYYRLLMVDLDGQTKISPIRSVVFGSNTSKSLELLVYPNPATDGIQVTWSANNVEQPTRLELYDFAGKLVYSEKIPEDVNQKYIDLNFSNLQSGLFVLRLMNGTTQIEQRRVIIER